MQNSPENQSIKNKLVYYALLIDRVICFGIAAQSTTTTNFFYDSLSNRNNGDWSPNVKDSYISYLNGSYNLGGFLGPFITIIFGRSNTKMLYTLIRVVFIMGTCALCASNNIMIMTVSKFFIGLAYMPMYIIIFWYEYHNLLPEDRQRAFNLNTTLGATCIFTVSTLSYFDPGNWWFWRACHLIFAFLVVISIIIELTVLRNINCVSFFTLNGKYSEAEECLNSYIEQETVAKMIQLEREDLNSEHGELIRQERGQIEHIGSSKKSSFSLFLEDLKKSKKKVAYVIFMFILLSGSFYDLIFGLSTYLGAKEMSDISAVKETKKWVSMRLTGKLAFASFLSYVVPNKKRKEVLELGHTVGLCLMLGISVSYLVEKLFIANICVFLFFTISAGWFPTFLVYPNDILKLSLSSIAYITHSLIQSALYVVVPNFVEFELRTKQEIGLRLLVILVLGLMANITLRYFLVETYDPVRSTAVMVEDDIEMILM